MAHRPHAGMAAAGDRKIRRIDIAHDGIGAALGIMMGDRSHAAAQFQNGTNGIVRQPRIEKTEDPAPIADGLMIVRMENDVGHRHSGGVTKDAGGRAAAITYAAIRNGTLARS